MTESVEKNEKPMWARLISALTLTVVFTAIIAAIGIGAHYAHFTTTPVLGPGESKTVAIPQGTAWKNVVDLLRRERVISVGPYFDFWARRRGLHQSAKAGTYKFQGPMTLEQLAKHLVKGGDIQEVTFTIPEGYSIFKIGDALEQGGIVSKADFLKSATDGTLMIELGVKGESMEGYLFPDTYRFRRGGSAETIVRKLHKKWRSEWDKITADHKEAYDKTKTEFGFDDHDIVTLASLIERETGRADERPLIASVFLNRTKKGMRYQTDPTCVYGAKTYLEVPSPKSCKDPLNRYSTYVIDGLPPGPIANPSRDALLSVIKPSRKKGADKYLYFVAKRDGKGSHHFSKTLKEHNDAVNKYLKKK